MNSQRHEHTIHATLHKSELVPHFAPKMTSGQRYCRVWISSVKWCSIQVAWENKRLKEIDEYHITVLTVPKVSNFDCNF